MRALKVLPAVPRDFVDATASGVIDSSFRNDLKSNMLLDDTWDFAAASNKTVMACRSLHSHVHELRKMIYESLVQQGAVKCCSCLYRCYFIVVETENKEVHIPSLSHSLPTQICSSGRHILWQESFGWRCPVPGRRGA